MVGTLVRTQERSGWPACEAGTSDILHDRSNIYHCGSAALVFEFPLASALVALKNEQFAGIECGGMNHEIL